MNKITIIDTTLRDGLQHEEHYMSLEKRQLLLKKMIDAGLRKIEVGSLSHPVYLPQFREIDTFLKEYLPDDEELEYTVLALNTKAVSRVEDLLRSGVRIDRVLTGQVATSESYARKNMNRSREELLQEAGNNVKRLHDAGIKTVCGNVGTVFGCPIEGDIPLSIAYEYTAKLFDMGFDEIEYADTEGNATPDAVREFFGKTMEQWPDSRKHVFHAHDIYGAGIVSYFAALEEGIANFECCIGGIGGQPANIMDGVPIKGTGEYYYKQGRTGLVAEEDFVTLLNKSGYRTGIDEQKLIRIGLELEHILNRELSSFITAKFRGSVK